MASSPLTPRALNTVVYGHHGPELLDPAELYHEASKTSRSTLARDTPGLPLLEADPRLQAIVARAVKRHTQRRAIALPPPARLEIGMADALERRRSGRSFGDAAVAIEHLATILHAGYGAAARDGMPRRSVPSGGALYPLELYVIALSVTGVTAGLYHYDPLRHVLEQLESRDLRETFRHALLYPELADAGVALAITAMFWRSRFKYGLRGYRFALLEAGHVMQNVLLTCAGLGLCSIPVGGVYDRSVERLLRVDGVNESLVYCAALGPAGDPA